LKTTAACMLKCSCRDLRVKKIWKIKIIGLELQAKTQKKLGGQNALAAHPMS